MSAWLSSTLHILKRKNPTTHTYNRAQQELFPSRCWAQRFRSLEVSPSQ